MTGFQRLYVSATLVACLAAPVTGCSALHAAPTADDDGVDQRYLLRQSFGQFPGKQVTIFEGHFSAGSATPLHRHPGTEILYVLRGRGEMDRPGQETIPLEPGSVVMVEPAEGERDFIHRARNVSASEAMTTLVIVIHDEGGPTMIPVDD